MTNIPRSERSKWIGASESAALFGVSPYVTRFELWHMKRGTIAAHDLDSVERVQAGQFLEPSIAAWASNKWHWPVRNVAEYIENPRAQRMGASLDFQTIEGEPVEIKNVDWLVFRDGDYEMDGDTLIDAPAHFLIQVQHQISCLTKPVERGWLVVCVGGNRLYRMEIPRHDRLIARIEREVDEFWQSVIDGNEPSPDFQADADTISLVYSTQGEHVEDLREHDRFEELCYDYLDALEYEKAAKKRKSAALAEIKTIMKDAAVAIGPSGLRVKGSVIGEITSVRKAHRRFSVTQSKQE